VKYSTRVVLQMTEDPAVYVVVDKDSHEFSGQPDLACGPSGEEQGLEASSSSFSRTLQGAYQTLFGQQQGTLAQLNSRLNQIASGTTGPGFGADELNAKTSQIVNQAAANARNVEQAESNLSAGQVFAGQSDTSGLARASAIRQQLTGEAESAAETQKANALENLTATNYAQGRENAIRTVGGLQTLAGLESPTPYASEAVNENQAAFGQANKINQENNQKWSDIAGGITGLVKTGLSFASGGLANMGEGSGIGDFFSGGLQALSGKG